MAFYYFQFQYMLGRFTVITITPLRERLIQRWLEIIILPSVKYFSHVKDSNSGTRSRCLDLLILWPWSLPKSKFATCLLSKLRNFIFEEIKVITSKVHRQILEPYHCFFFSIFLFLTIVSNLLEQISSDFRVLSFYYLSFYYVADIYLSKAHKKYGSNRAQVSYSIMGFKGPNSKNKKDWMGSIPIFTARWINEPQPKMSCKCDLTKISARTEIWLVTRSHLHHQLTKAFSSLKKKKKSLFFYFNFNFNMICDKLIAYSL